MFSAYAKFTSIVDVDTAPFVEHVIEKVPGAQELVRLFHMRSPLRNTIANFENDNVSAARRDEARVLRTVPEENKSSVHTSLAKADEFWRLTCQDIFGWHIPVGDLDLDSLVGLYRLVSRRKGDRVREIG